jgi:hypothetical protein
VLLFEIEVQLLAVFLLTKVLSICNRQNLPSLEKYLERSSGKSLKFAAFRPIN